MLHNKISVDQDFDSIIEQTQTVSDGKVVARKVVADNHLNFNSEGIAGQMLENAYVKGETLTFLINESDQAVLDNKDKISTCLTRSAGDIADLVEKYIQISDNFDRVISNNPEKYQPFKNQLERYLGTHQCVGESFLAKILLKTSGQDAVNDFLTETNGAGFSETQGFDIEIEKGSYGEKILLSYDLGSGIKTIDFSTEMINELINERDELNSKVNQE